MASSRWISWRMPSSALGIEVGPTRLRACRSAGGAGAREAMEVEWGSPPPPESLAALRERFGTGNVIAVALDMSVVHAKRVDLPPLSMDERRRILAMDPRRYFPVRYEAMVAGVRDDDLVVAVALDVFESWVTALGELGSVERVEPTPSALIRHLAVHDFRRGVIVLDDADGGGTTLASLVDGRLAQLRKVYAGEGELPGLVAELLMEGGACTLHPWREEVAVELEAHLGENATVVPVPTPPGVPGAFSSAYGALLGLDASPALTLASPSLARRVRAVQRRRTAAGVGAVLGALALVGWALDYRRGATLDALEREVAVAEAQADPVLELRREALALTDDLRRLEQAAEDRTNPLEVLQAITRLLPPDAYLTRLAASGDEWELNGRASDAARLIALLEGSNLLADVRFRTATTRVRVGGEEMETFTVVFRHVPTT